MDKPQILTVAVWPGYYRQQIATIKIPKNPSKMKRFILVPLTWLATMFFLIEEFIWDQMERLMARLGTLFLIHGAVA
jgi:hypothetical protein